MSSSRDGCHVEHAADRGATTQIERLPWKRPLSRLKGRDADSALIF